LAAKQSLAGLPPLEEKRAALEALKREWEQADGKLMRLSSLNGECRDLLAKQAELAAWQGELAKAQEEISLLPPLDGAQSAFRALGQEREKAKAVCSALASLSGDCADIAKRQGDLAALRDKFEKRSVEFRAADSEHKAIEDAFLRGQAGLLAQTLEGGKPCPVCGSTEHPSPALLPMGKVTESELKKARDEAEKARGQREEAANACAIAKTQVKTLSGRFLSDLQKIVPAASLEDAGALLDESLRAAELALANLAEKMAAEEKALAGLARQWESARKKCDELAPQCTQMKAALDTRGKRFFADASEFIPAAEREGAGEKLAALLAAGQEIACKLAARKKAGEEALADLAQKQQEAAKRNLDAEKAQEAAQALVAERELRAAEQRKSRDEAADAYAAALKACNFASSEQYQASLMTEDELAAAAERLSAYEKEGELLQAEDKRLTAETREKEKPDLEKIALAAEAANAAAAKLRGERDAVKSRLGQTEDALTQLRQSETRYAQLEKRYAAAKQLSDVANGRLDFETYAQAAYFGRVLRAANLRLKLMSQSRYALLRKAEGGDSRKRSGLDIEVLDSYTGKARSANSLSGGESFMASLSLALGLSDVVQQNAGGIRLDAMFIDEGFGSLDSEVLELAVRTLSDMTANGRSIGIISHVAELRERIDKQVRVEKTPAGSRVKIFL
jgi:exonuclease SbcC